MSDRHEPDDLPGFAEAYRRTPASRPEARHSLDERLAREPLPRPRSFWSDGRSITVSRPIALATAAVLLVLVGLGLAMVLRAPAHRLAVAPDTPGSGDLPTAATGPRDVEFVLVVPGASQVSVVGDFNGWDALQTPMRRVHADGTWAASVPLPAGAHAYAFVVDGHRWVNDPTAPLAPPDDFGASHSILVVNGEGL